MRTYKVGFGLGWLAGLACWVGFLLYCFFVFFCQVGFGLHGLALGQVALGFDLLLLGWLWAGLALQGQFGFLLLLSLLLLGWLWAELALHWAGSALGGVGFLLGWLFFELAFCQVGFGFGLGWIWAELAFC